MKTIQDIKASLNENKRYLFNKYPIRSLAIFGSYARNEQTDVSDLDLMVDIDGQIGIQFIDLANEIEDLIGIKIDLVSRGGIKDKYYKAIEDELIYV